MDLSAEWVTPAIKLSKSNLYATYIDLNKMLYINKSITKYGLLKYNSNFNSNEGTWYKIKDGNGRIGMMKLPYSYRTPGLI